MDLLVKIIKELIDELALLILFLLIKRLLLFLEVFILGILLLAFDKSQTIEQLVIV